MTSTRKSSVSGRSGRGSGGTKSKSKPTGKATVSPRGKKTVKLASKARHSAAVAKRAVKKLPSRIQTSRPGSADKTREGRRGTAGRVKATTGSAEKKTSKPKAARGAVTAEVRPLGVLPPESMARSHPRPASSTGVSARVSEPPATATAHAGQGAKRVTEQDMKEFETRLLEERRKILKEMGHLETTVLKVNQRDSAGDLSGYSFHMADAGTDAMEREKAFLFASAEGRTLLEINEALRRLYRGEYGICENCGQPIARARLDAMPNARLCLVCKEKEERAQRGAV
jgi:DnaK suppressor protein